MTHLAAGDTRRGKTRERIIAAARALMTEHDHLDISIAEITERAGANIAAVSYHFGGREGLMVSIARADADDLLGEFDRLLAKPLAPAAKLHAHVVGVVRAYHERPYLHRLLHKLLREGSSATAALVGEFFARPVYEGRRRIIEEGMADGSFRPVEPRLVAHVLEGACAHIFTSAAARAVVLDVDRLDRATIDRLAEGVAELVVRGVLSQGALVQRGD